MSIVARPRRGRRAAFAVAVLAVALPACTSHPAPNPVIRLGAPRIQGPLTTDGTRIVDATGATVRFIGADLGGMGKGDGLTGTDAKAQTGCPGWQAPPASAFRNIDDWGFNTVRISLSWANMQPDQPVMSGDTVTDPRWNTAYLDALDQVVRGFTDRGIAVILHMSQSHWSPAFGNLETNKGSVKCAGVGMPDWLYDGVSDEIAARRSFFADEGHQQELYADAWKFVAERYASNDLVVAADMMNEPYTKNRLTLDELNLDQLYQTLGTAIRSVNPTILLAFQDSQYKPGADFALSSPPPLPGVVYTFHYYVDNWSPDGQAQLQTYLDRANAWNVPLWIGEFDAFSYASPRPSDVTWRSDLSRMMNVTQQSGVSWTEFSYADRWILQPGTDEPKPDLLATLKTGVGGSSQPT
jgi:Cellulase (glycosyl hydrolase family 5)